MASLVHGWGASSPVAGTFEDGEEIVLRDRRLIASYRPGHSPTDTLLFDRATGLAFTGDHLLADISSSPLISRPSVEEDARRPRPLLDFRHSLQETRRLDISVALPGHGRPFTDHRTLIDARLQAQARRAERFYDFLAEGPLNAREIATREWPSFAIAQAFLTLSAVLGALDLLIEEGRVVEDADRTPIRFGRVNTLKRVDR
jgi:glyoxylase-like metal-dependent hydrolase (beta-lactamase superfamily II)